MFPTPDDDWELFCTTEWCDTLNTTSLATGDTNTPTKAYNAREILPNFGTKSFSCLTDDDADSSDDTTATALLPPNTTLLDTHNTLDDIASEMTSADNVDDRKSAAITQKHMDLPSVEHGMFIVVDQLLQDTAVPPSQIQRINPEQLPTGTNPTNSPNATTLTTKMIFAHPTEFNSTIPPGKSNKRVINTLYAHVFYD